MSTDYAMIIRRKRLRREAQIRFMQASLFFLSLGFILLAMGGCAKQMSEREILNQMLEESLSNSIIRAPDHFPAPKPFVQVRFT